MNDRDIRGLSERLGLRPPLLLDSAMGTEIERRGGRCDLPLWSARALAEDPGLVLAIHRDDVMAGADILTANTFRTNRRTLAKAGLEGRARELTRLAVTLARRAAESAPLGRLALVAGSLAPAEDCYRPDLAPDDAALAREHGELARTLAEARVDLILCETHNSVRELVAAVAAAKATGLPVVASIVTDGSGCLLSGEAIGDAVRAIAPLLPDVVSVNCVPAERLAMDLARLGAAASGTPLAAYGNLGPPEQTGGTVFDHDVPPDRYSGLARDWVSLGARIVGGCCGTTAAHTRGLREMLDRAA